MDIVFTVQHPAHVHLFRNAIELLQEQGHTVHTFARKKDIVVDLLELYDVSYELLAGSSSSMSELAFQQAKYEFRIFKKALSINPDVMLAMSEPGVAHTSFILDCPSILFTDTEYAKLQNTLAFPFADRVCTPTCYQDSIGEKQVYYDGYHELAYLHPNRFTPDPDVLNGLDLEQDDSFTIVRLNAWNAAHFVGDAGFADIHDLIASLEETGTEVLITSEPDLPASLEEYTVDISLEKIHDLMYYADLLIGESATMASESAVLGTPAIFISTSRRGYTDELGDRYGLVYTFSGRDRQKAGIEKAITILNNAHTEKWSQRREKMLEDKIDTTEFILDQTQDVTSY